jgi:alginate O-acetyltransferase complex protein AlgI
MRISVNTEITDKVKLNGWVLYDADCRHCVALAKRFEAALARRQFELVPLQTAWVRERLGLPDAELLAEMRLLKADGEMAGGADALLEIGGQFWWAWPWRQLGRITLAMNLFRAGYRWIARHRHCAGGACEIHHPGTHSPRRQWFDFLPLLFLTSCALLCRPIMAPWLFMWTTAMALYAGCKWLTYRAVVGNGAQPGQLRAYGYLLAWPGMAAAEFLGNKVPPAKPHGSEWTFALAKMFFGAILLWIIARLALPAHPLPTGWLGMAGVVFILHFGLFHLLSLAWRQAGVRAEPVMQNPLRATSAADFWGGRWNTAFNELAFRFAFRPLRRWTTPAVATLAAFGLSGMIHELVISVPARGGYGRPTLYFLIQGLGVLAERTRAGHRLGLGHGLRGWLFTLLVTAGPVAWLFHPPFITNVILPMLTAIGAT